MSEETKKSTDEGVNVNDAKEHINSLESVEEIEAYVEGDDREGVKKAVGKRVNELNSEDETEDLSGSVEVEKSVLASVADAVQKKVDADKKFRGMTQPSAADKGLIEANEELKSLLK